MNESNGTPLDTYARRVEELEQDRDVWKHLAQEREKENKVLSLKSRIIDRECEVENWEEAYKQMCRVCDDLLALLGKYDRRAIEFAGIIDRLTRGEK